jgi:alpha-tubulin suppressor-like RCC1 family protein
MCGTALWRMASVISFIGLCACGGVVEGPAPNGGAAFTTVAAGLRHTCATTAAGTAYCWGSNSDGQLGSAAAMETCQVLGTSAPCSSTPVPVQGGRAFTTMSSSFTHTCGLSTGGEAFCWGNGLGGQLGDGTQSSSVVPVAVAGGHAFSSISASTWGSVTCGLAADGAAFCWGPSQMGQLGNGSTGGSSSPVVVSGGLHFSSLGVGELHACAVTVLGAAYCWGSNWYGQLGVGSTGQFGGLPESLTPVPVSGGLAFASVVSGVGYSCALTAAGAAYCWGYLSGGADWGSSPVPVAGGLSFTSLAAGAGHVCGLTSEGRAYCWGDNQEAQLGDSTTQERPTPTPVSGGLTFQKLSAGGGHTCGIAKDAKTYCWGTDTFGNLGQGRSGGTQMSPVLVVGPS